MTILAVLRRQVLGLCLRDELGCGGMAVEVTIGPPVLTINHGNTFMVTDLLGEIAAT